MERRRRRLAAAGAVVLTTWAAPLAAAEKAAEAGGPAVIVGASSEDGFVIRSDDGSYKLQLKGLLQVDGRFFPADAAEALVDNFLIRRARPILQGTVAGRFDFNFSPDFGGPGTTIQDAYLDAKATRAVGLRVGKQKPPIGVEHLQRDAYIAFPERALPSALLPNRDVGAQVHGDLGGGVVSYGAGVFDGTPDGTSVDLDTSDGKALVGRLVLSPFRSGSSLAKGLSIGLGASTEHQGGPSATLAGYRTGGQNFFFVGYASGVGAAGTRTRLAPELSYFQGPVGVLAEWVRSEGKVARTTTTGGVTATSPPVTIRAEAWQATVSVCVTGDTSTFDGVKVKRPLDRAKGQWGALQFAARVNALTVDEAAFTLGWADPARSARKAFGWGLAVNWWLNRNLREAVSYDRTTFQGGAPQGDRPPENALIVRTQLSF